MDPFMLIFLLLTHVWKEEMKLFSPTSTQFVEKCGLSKIPLEHYIGQN